MPPFAPPHYPIPQFPRAFSLMTFCDTVVAISSSILRRVEQTRR